MLREFLLLLQFFGEFGGFYPSKIPALGHPRRNKFFCRGELGFKESGDGNALARAVILREFSQGLLEVGPVFEQFIGATIPNSGRSVKFFEVLNLGLFKCNDLNKGFLFDIFKPFLGIIEGLGQRGTGFVGHLNRAKRIVHSGDE